MSGESFHYDDNYTITEPDISSWSKIIKIRKKISTRGQNKEAIIKLNREKLNRISIG